MDDFKKGNSLAELAKIESCRGDLQCTSVSIQLHQSMQNPHQPYTATSVTSHMIIVE
jgi:hypothetical protein